MRTRRHVGGYHADAYVLLHSLASQCVSMSKRATCTQPADNSLETLVRIGKTYGGTPLQTESASFMRRHTAPSKAHDTPILFSNLSIDVAPVVHWQRGFQLNMRVKKHSNDLLRAVFGNTWSTNGEKDWLEHCLKKLLKKEEHAPGLVLLATNYEVATNFDNLSAEQQRYLPSLVDDLVKVVSDGTSRLRWQLTITPKRKREEPKPTPQCTICLENIPNVLLRPCKHLAVCGECAEQPEMVGALMGPYGGCPVCRAKVEEFETVYWT